MCRDAFASLSCYEVWYEGCIVACTNRIRVIGVEHNFISFQEAWFSPAGEQREASGYLEYRLVNVRKRAQKSSLLEPPKKKATKLATDSMGDLTGNLSVKLTTCFEPIHMLLHI